MTRFPRERAWHPLESVVPSWAQKTPTMKELRAWNAPLVAGNKQLAPLVANNVRRRFSLQGQARRLLRGLGRKKNPNRR